MVSKYIDLDSPITLLLLDDDFDDAFFLERALKRITLNKRSINYRFEHYDDPEFFFKALENSVSKNLVLLIDIKMPKMDGYEAIKRAAAIPHLKNVPIFVYSSSANTPLINEALAAGARSSIEKALSIDEIACQLERVLHDL